MARVRERGEEAEESGSAVKEVVTVVTEGVRKFGQAGLPGSADGFDGGEFRRAADVHVAPGDA